MKSWDEKSQFFKLLATGDWPKAHAIASEPHIDSLERAQWRNLRGQPPFIALEECLVNDLNDQSSGSIQTKVNPSGKTLLESLPELGRQWCALGFSAQDANTQGHRPGSLLLEQVRLHVEKESNLLKRRQLEGQGSSVAELKEFGQKHGENSLRNLLKSWANYNDYRYGHFSRLTDVVISFMGMLEQIEALSPFEDPRFSFLDFTLLASSWPHPRLDEMLTICDKLKAFPTVEDESRFCYPLVKTALALETSVSIMEKLHLHHLTRDILAERQAQEPGLQGPNDSHSPHSSHDAAAKCAGVKLKSRIRL